MSSTTNKLTELLCCKCLFVCLATNYSFSVEKIRRWDIP